jgi:hypothetical protein
MKNALFLILLLFSCPGCDREQEYTEPGSEVDFYLLDTYSTPEGSMKIIDSTAVINDSALISYNEILSYNPQTYFFKVEEKALETLTYPSAFALTVDREIIYTGYIWSSISSMSVDWVVIDIFISIIAQDNVFRVELGYPGTPPGNIIPDRRNDPRILSVFERDNKLVD